MADRLKDKAGASYADARAKVGDAVAKGRVKADKAVSVARAKAETAANVARAKALEATSKARESAAQARNSAEENARKAAKTTVESVERNPLVAVAGGIAIGAIIAALLPRTAREDSVAGDFGRKVRSTAKKAASNARDTAKEQLDTLGVNADAAKGGLRNLVEKISEAATSAGNAAAETLRKGK
jgi:ElaB/YqjD/DUF883 family membrane-anchored ribosome-binding protein